MHGDVYKRKDRTSKRSNGKKKFVEKSIIDEGGLIPSVSLLPNNLVEDGPNSLETDENAGITLTSSEEIETISWSSSPFVNGEPENEILGPYHDLDSSSSIDFLSVNEKDNESYKYFSNGGVSLSSNGAAAAPAAESTNEWYVPSCSTTSRDRQVVIDEGRNYELLSDEGDELLSWLWDINQ
ncbi:hypothetical protein FRX31_029617 [Thalictrum thalictroides]|uniref:Uncharacterized protein n=1 Tax=Thalictrum thalictroides TaxID=46969 RepID=A0A7J6V6Z7_THATH|nr:hypothetical protein FRX31_029617 [Thalictrum thalictroides]